MVVGPAVLNLSSLLLLVGDEEEALFAAYFRSVLLNISGYKIL
jgi:hypothetical protein